MTEIKTITGDNGRKIFYLDLGKMSKDKTTTLIAKLKSDIENRRFKEKE